MQTYNRFEAIELMNRFGREARPFLFVIDYELKKNHIIPIEEIDSKQLLFDFNGVTNHSHKCTLLPTEVTWQKYPISFEEYLQSFNVVLKHLNLGNSFLTNLTAATPITTNLTLQSIFDHSNAKYKLWMKDLFCALSPEIFVRIEEGRIASYPMKGTIDASVPDAENCILSDPKEQAEHATIVDLIRNDLSIFAHNVTVSRYRYIDRLQTNEKELLQVSSEITGLLSDDYPQHLGDILYSLLPAGSICGAPKNRTLQNIAEAETTPRGYYTGVAGIFDGRNLDSGVLIRFIEQQPNGSYLFRSGGGITAKSDPKSEYEELIQKVYVPLCREH